MYKITLSSICLAVFLFATTSKCQIPDSLSLSVSANNIIQDTVDVDNDSVNNGTKFHNYRVFESIAFGFRSSSSGVADMNNTITVEFQIGLEKPHYNVGLMAILNENQAINAFSSWLLSESKVCPYLGGAVGYGKVDHEDYIITSPSSQSGHYQKKTEHGLELTGNLGIILFRSYNLRFIMNLAFVRTFNDYHDECVLYTIGIMGNAR